LPRSGELGFKVSLFLKAFLNEVDNLRGVLFQFGLGAAVTFFVFYAFSLDFFAALWVGFVFFAVALGVFFVLALWIAYPQYQRLKRDFQEYEDDLSVNVIFGDDD